MKNLDPNQKFGSQPKIWIPKKMWVPKKNVGKKKNLGKFFFAFFKYWGQNKVECRKATSYVPWKWSKSLWFGGGVVMCV